MDFRLKYVIILVDKKKYYELAKLARAYMLPILHPSSNSPPKRISFVLKKKILNKKESNKFGL